MKKSKTPTIVVIIILEIIATACGIVGFLQNKKGNTNNTSINEKQYTIKYKYYLDNVEIANIPENRVIESEEETTEETVYSFDHYTCTNNVKGEFDTKKWEFNVEETSDSTCKLYFVSNIFEVTINVTNGKLNELSASNNKTVKKGENATYIITPDDGYEYDDTSNCNNGANAEWNADNNTLTVSNVTTKTSCNIQYKIKSFNITVKVENGNAETENATVEYGKDLEFAITPNENMVYDKLECKPTMKSATYNTDSNKLILSNITSSSTCTVKFKQNAFKVTLNVENGTVVGDATKDIKKSGIVLFDIKANEGFSEVEEKSCDNGTISINNSIARVASVTQDTTCTIKFKGNDE